MMVSSDNKKPMYVFEDDVATGPYVFTIVKDDAKVKHNSVGSTKRQHNTKLTVFPTLSEEHTSKNATVKRPRKKSKVVSDVKTHSNLTSPEFLNSQKWYNNNKLLDKLRDEILQEETQQTEEEQLSYNNEPLSTQEEHKNIEIVAEYTALMDNSSNQEQHSSTMNSYLSYNSKPEKTNEHKSSSPNLLIKQEPHDDYVFLYTHPSNEVIPQDSQIGDVQLETSHVIPVDTNKHVIHHKWSSDKNITSCEHRSFCSPSVSSIFVGDRNINPVMMPGNILLPQRYVQAYLPDINNKIPLRSPHDRFYCEYCSKNYRTEGMLFRHMRIKHGQEDIPQTISPPPTPTITTAPPIATATLTKTYEPRNRKHFFTTFETNSEDIELLKSTIIGTNSKRISEKLPTGKIFSP